MAWPNNICLSIICRTSHFSFWLTFVELKTAGSLSAIANTRPTMPPKKKTAGGKKKGASSNNNGLDLSPEDQIKHLQCQVTALQVELAARRETAARAVADRESTKQDMADAAKAHDEEKEVSEAVIRDATRQYKAMKEQLLDKINVRDNTIQNLRDELERKQKYHEDMVEEKDGTIQAKTDEIQTLEKKMEDLCAQFAGMLGAALGKMTDFFDRKALEFSASDDVEEQLQTMYVGLKESSAVSTGGGSST